MANKYDSPVADPRDASPQAQPPRADMDDKIKRSNQEQFTDQGAKVMGNPKPSSGRKFNETPRDFGNQVKFAPNPFGSNTLKDALNTYKQTVKPAAVNPGPSGRNLTTTRKAAGRTPEAGPSNF